MKYLDWNDHIAKFFFKPENAGRDILFYLTKQDLIRYSRPIFADKSDDEIWTDFVYAIKYGQKGGNNSGTPYSPIERPLELFSNWNGTDTPPFIAYLILYIIPLTETYDEHFNATNYYGKVNVFFKKYRILNEHTEQSIGTGNFQNISHLWNELEEWSILTKNCDLGIFELKKFGNQNWIHVGKPFSQCVLPPSTINKLPELFFEAGLIPNSAFSKEEFRRILLRHGTNILGLKESVLELIRKSDSNELGQSIIEIIIREYRKWTGETHDGEEGGTTQRISRNYTVAPLFLQFSVNDNDGFISFSFRTYSSNDYPEDLCFGTNENIYETNGWSKTLHFDFKESFELKDDFNKWVARFPDRDVRLFLSAGTYQLSTGYWIETESLSKTDPMYLLCRNGKRDSIIEWGKTFSSGNFRIEDLDGLPDGYSLFKILNPVKSHPSIPLLTLYTQKRIELTGGLKVNFRTFINDFLPEVQISNSDGNEKVYLQYRNTEEKIFLAKKQSYISRWLLPPDTLLNIDFYIKVENENFSGNEIAYNLTSSNGTAIRIDGMQLPKRDSFGKYIEGHANQYCIGSNIVNPHKSSMRLYSPYSHLFTSTNWEIASQVSKATFNNHCGNMLCGFLTLKNVLTTGEFFSAFEFYYSKEFSERQTTASFNLTRTKKTALNFYDYTGILDYDYEMKKIVVNPPQLIFIPASHGRKVLLIGGRDSALVEEIINTAPKYNLQVEVIKQFSSNEKLLLPDAITIRSFGNSTENYGERNLAEFAKKLQIKYSNDYFPQIALQEFSSGISEYESSKQLTDENDYGWARRVFNAENLSFERSELATLDKSFSMIEYKLNEYTYYYKLWEDGRCYQVDRNWGKYLALKRIHKNVILFDNDRNRVAIPWETPVPRLLSESIMLLSGLAPDFREIDGKYYWVYENIPGIFTENLFRKLSQQPIKTELK
ncbi:hypothetical protein FAM09_03745 [Niastella caeni]|uniref:Uncharacterized protein n=1 Tax=Niastella caeni TaxID=2569763 RepID=A0A4S8I051_9BACT|nr:hypothetical protein [Niastella caeni]THU41235.1 hypothetical protein FAM09_03745 [Niastella caeni]